MYILVAPPLASSGDFAGFFFTKNPPPDQVEANKKKFSQIGPAVPEEIGHNHTNILLLYIEDIYKYIYIYIDI